MLRVEGALEEVEHVELTRRLGDAGGNVMILVEYQIGVLGRLPIRCDLASIDWTFGIDKHLAALLDVPRAQAVVQQNGLHATLRPKILIVWRHKHQLVRDAVTTRILVRHQLGQPLAGLLVDSRRLWITLAVGEIPRTCHEVVSLAVKFIFQLHSIAVVVRIGDLFVVAALQRTCRCNRLRNRALSMTTKWR